MVVGVPYRPKWFMRHVHAVCAVASITGYSSTHLVKQSIITNPQCPLARDIHVFSRASTWPGSRGIEDDVGKDEDPELDDNSESTVEPDSAAALRQSTRKCDFEEVIKRAVVRGGMSGKDFSAETVQRAYGGK